jgi:hypothetical protein
MLKQVCLHPVVTCGAREQAVAITKAGQESSQAMLAKYQQLATTINDKGDPSCANSRISSLVVNEREDLGLAHSASEDLMHIWVVDGAASQGEFWFIHAQSDPQAIA